MAGEHEKRTGAKERKGTVTGLAFLKCSTLHCMRTLQAQQHSVALSYPLSSFHHISKFASCKLSRTLYHSVALSAFPRLGLVQVSCGVLGLGGARGGESLNIILYIIYYTVTI